MEEIAGKRFPHKRAFVRDDVMVELDGIEPEADGTCTTCFWDTLRMRWPQVLVPIHPRHDGRRLIL
jgi:hypothetical protein